MTSPRVADNEINKAVNNWRNWNVIDDVVHYIVYRIPKERKESKERKTEETESGHKTMVAPETEKDDSRNIYKERTVGEKDNSKSG